MRCGYYRTRSPIENLRLGVKLRQLSGDTTKEWIRTLQWNERLHHCITIKENYAVKESRPPEFVLSAYSKVEMEAIRCEHLGPSQPPSTHLPRLNRWGEIDSISLNDKNCQIARDRFTREYKPESLFIVALLEQEFILLCSLTFFSESRRLILTPDLPTSLTFETSLGTRFEYFVENLSDIFEELVNDKRFAIKPQRYLSVTQKSLFQLRLLKLCGWAHVNDRLRVDYQILIQSLDCGRKMVGRRSCLLTQQKSIVFLGFYDAFTLTDVTQILTLRVQVYAVDSWSRLFFKGCGEIAIPFDSPPGMRHVCMEKPLQSFYNQLEEYFLGVEDTFIWSEYSQNQPLRRTKSTNMKLSVQFSVFPSKRTEI
ncbi:unnamed protein product [Albugo candida]|uniref:Uncharacterized protein n=1 Tax=Albugo candida TaxID=65357 RepID=A0A024G7F5_9STRA|nr:unnamed protein product [Albugo candida]|eukprot:CCI42599.1 unnamed protein product [Albugo candida]